MDPTGTVAIYQAIDRLTAELKSQRHGNLQRELLDLIKLMPDSQVDEILSFVATLREARRRI